MPWVDNVVEGNLARRVLRIVIECGENTCASEPGKFCQYLGSTKLGTVTICTLFPSTHESFTYLENTSAGWVERCAACKQAN